MDGELFDNKQAPRYGERKSEITKNKPDLSAYGQWITTLQNKGAIEFITNLFKEREKE